MRLLHSALQHGWKQVPAGGVPPLAGHTGGCCSHWLVWEGGGKDCGGWMNQPSVDSPCLVRLGSHSQRFLIVVSSPEI